MLWKQRRRGPALEPTTPAGEHRPDPSVWSSSGVGSDGSVGASSPAGLPDDVRKALALALHRRWHGEHTLVEHGIEKCAELSGAYDDIAALEPLILALLKGET